MGCSGVEGGCQNHTRANHQATDVHPPATDGPSGAMYVLSKFAFGPVQTYIFLPWKTVLFLPVFLCANGTVGIMATPSITDPFAIVHTSKEVLLCFFGVYGSVLSVHSESSSD